VNYIKKIYPIQLVSGLHWLYDGIYGAIDRKMFAGQGGEPDIMIPFAVADKITAVF
jgi:hypothetical protein